MQTGFPLPDRAVQSATSDIDLVCLLENEIDGKVRNALDSIYDDIEAEDPDAYSTLRLPHAGGIPQVSPVSSCWTGALR